MSKHIFEEKLAEGGAPGQVGNAKAAIEKKARQLAYDTRYQVKREMGDKKVDPASLQRALIGRLQKSSAIPAVKMRAKQMLVGEDYKSDLGDLAANTVANALYKVFVEGVQKEETIELDYLKELAENPDNKYKISVFDPKSETRYVRYATREKISQLRAKGLKVELTEYGEPRESEAKKGSQTASALGGGSVKKDYDGDGKVESGAKEHAGSVHNAIQRKKGGVPDGQDTSSVKEEFITDAAATKDQNEKKVTGKGVNNSRLIKIMPEDGSDQLGARGTMKMSYEMGGDVLSEMAKSKAQRKFMGMVRAEQEGKMKGASPELKVAAKSMTKSQAHDFAVTKEKGLPYHKKTKEVNESACDSSEPQKDPRGDYAKKEVIKNKLRAAFGVKNPIVMVSGGDDVKEGLGLSVGISKIAGQLNANPRTSAEQGAKSFQKNVTDPIGNVVKNTVRTVLQPANNSSEAKKARENKYRPEEVELEGKMVDEAAERVKGKLQSGTRTFTGIGYYGRTSKEKKDPKKMKRVFPGPKGDRESDGGDHPSLSAAERNPNLR
jgi:hypothetical protein